MWGVQSLRGRLWKTFLRTHTVQQPGAYDALVSQALAPQFQNSTVTLFDHQSL